MSQRLNSGFSWPGFSIAAVEPLAPVPETNSVRSRPKHFCRLLCAVLAPSTPSDACGVDQWMSCWACTCPFAGIFQVLRERGSASPAFGVGQPASRAATDSGIPSTRDPDLTSCRDLASCSSGVLPVLYTVGVGQCVSFASSLVIRFALPLPRSLATGVRQCVSLAWSLRKPVASPDSLAVG